MLSNNQSKHSDTSDNPFDQFCVISDIPIKTNNLISINRIRHLIRYRNRHEGFDLCIKKVGKEWVINLPQLANYLANS